MIRVCMVCDKIFGEKPPYEDRSYTHGICDECFPKEIERLKKELERYKKEEKKMKYNFKPRKGDFVLWEGETWVIVTVRGVHESKNKLLWLADIENLKSGDTDILLVDSLIPTDIRTWEVE